jgi:hypothetical protein
MIDKALKILWVVNGVLLLAIILFVGYRLFLEEFRVFGNNETETGLVIGGDEAKAITTGEKRQGLIYEEIQSVPGTSFHILPISTRVFKSVKAEEQYYAGLSSGPSGDISLLAYGNVNLIFMDIDYRVITTLLNRKAFIHTAASPGVAFAELNTLDATIKKIVYLISFEDSNSDGVLDENDSSDLYISDVDGSDLLQVTKNVLVLDYKFINSNTELLISYQNAADARSPFQTTRFAKYQINRDSLIEMSKLHDEIANVDKLLRIDTTVSIP